MRLDTVHNARHARLANALSELIWIVPLVVAIAVVTAGLLSGCATLADIGLLGAGWKGN